MRIGRRVPLGGRSDHFNPGHGAVVVSCHCTAGSTYSFLHVPLVLAVRVANLVLGRCLEDRATHAVADPRRSSDLLLIEGVQRVLVASHRCVSHRVVLSMPRGHKLPRQTYWARCTTPSTTRTVPSTERAVHGEGLLVFSDPVLSVLQQFCCSVTQAEVEHDRNPHEDRGDGDIEHGKPYGARATHARCGNCCTHDERHRDAPRAADTQSRARPERGHWSDVRESGMKRLGAADSDRVVVPGRAGVVARTAPSAAAHHRMRS